MRPNLYDKEIPFIVVNICIGNLQISHVQIYSLSFIYDGL